MIGDGQIQAGVAQGIGGESGAIASPAAIANALEDALAPFAIGLTRTPLTPRRIFELPREGCK